MLLKNKLEKCKTFIKNDNVLTTMEERYCYSTDAGNYNKGKVPDLVVFVETIEEVQSILKYANQHKIPVIARGAGTNMVGSCVCTQGGIVLNFSKMNKILEFSPVNMTIKVQSGVILGDLKDFVEEHNLYFPPDPSNYKVSTIGGGIAQSSSGAKAFKYGSIKDYVLSLKVVTAEGKLMTLGAETIKDSVGYHLGQLIIGSEGTLAIVVEAVLKLIPKPQNKTLVLAYHNEIEQTTNTVEKILVSNIFPSAIDFMDKNSMRTVNQYKNCGLKEDNNTLLIIEIDSYNSNMQDQIEKIKEILDSYNIQDYEITNDKARIEEIWNARHSSYAAVTRLAPDVISDDIIVPREKLAELVTFCNNITEKFNLRMCLVGHIGDGNLHPQIALNLENEEEMRNCSTAKSLIYEEVIRLGGTISGEHGIGLDKMPYFKQTVDKNALEYMKMIKKIFDPNNILNPGKIFDT
ncbi:MAG: FAD-binding protein [Cyanobacteria bacterium SIG28]|nr:FAD-binding protein [Cyanobacteria bacterium SIG28]